MAASIRNSCTRVAGALLLATLGTTAVAAELARPGDAFNWDADVVTSDFRSDTLEFSGNVRVTQGPMSIEAGAAKAQDVRSENSRWTFQKAVHITHGRSRSAVGLGERRGQRWPARARASEGSPAQFEQRGGSANRQVRGRAGVIEYDFIAGIVKLTNQVWFSNGKDEFRGDVVIYNVRDERVQINPGGHRAIAFAASSGRKSTPKTACRRLRATGQHQRQSRGAAQTAPAPESGA